MNVNTLGEVPDSSWFQNRHGAMRMSAEDLARGPNTSGGPSMDQPWIVMGAKTEGVTPGFRIRDLRGDEYFIKFDPPRNAEMATAAEVISTDLLSLLFVGAGMVSILARDSYLHIYNEYPRLRAGIDGQGWFLWKRSH